MLEIRWHGRGGQGAVTAAKMLAAAALRQGKQFQAFPEYGPERRGAPVQVFTRISDEPVRTFSYITEPNMIVILDPNLIGKVPVTDGLTEDGVVVANFKGTPDELRKTMGIKGRKLYTVDATGVAMRTMGRAITNTPMLGAVVRASGAVTLDQALEEVRHVFEDRFGPKVAEANVEAVKVAYEETQGE
ncbi:MAG: 2-oxoacid:acceptor oxidoreductase family protein [Chloroflexi bacterium]|nr:2-oxoacid:acceptor oxidoreductase family protein [Chloroflexota bacterium]